MHMYMCVVTSMHVCGLLICMMICMWVCMYQFSLDAYVDLFNQSMDKSRTSPKNITGTERCRQINVAHTLSVYQYTCRGLFERDKLLFALQLCLRIMTSENKVPTQEFDFLCRGGAGIERADQRPNP